jgi:hypothetical protein
VKQQSGLFGSMVRSLEGAQLEPGDSEYRWPQTVVATTPSGFTHDGHELVAAGGAETYESRTSFVASTFISRAAGLAEQSVFPFRLGAGRWFLRFDYYGSFAVAFTQCYAQMLHQSADLSTPIQTTNLFLIQTPQAILTLQWHQEHYVHIAKGTTIRFKFALDNTGGATISYWSAFFNCIRLA